MIRASSPAQADHEFIEQGATGFDLAAIFTGAIGVVSDPAAPFVELVAAYLKAEGALVRAVDQGKGAYVSMTWLAPGIFVPTAIT